MGLPNEDFSGLIPDTWTDMLSDAADLTKKGVQIYQNVTAKASDSPSQTVTSAANVNPKTAVATTQSNSTMWWVIGGVGAVVLIVVGFLLMRPK
jgi:hypothetical protein